MTHQIDVRTTASSVTPPTVPSGAAALPRRRRDAVLARLLARLLAPRLDARLARGAAPEVGSLLAARAATLVEPSARVLLADAWADLLRRTEDPRGLVDARVPIARDEVRSAAGEIGDLVAALRSPAPVAAGDVARARLLLTDAGGPVYRAGRGLRRSVAGLAAALDRGRDGSWSR